MPRKTDGIIYELHPGPRKGDDGEPLLYAEAVVKRRYSIDDLDDFCAKYRGTFPGDVRRLLDTVREVSSMWLRQGARVETPFGSFGPRLKLLGEHTVPEKVVGRDIMYGGLDFIPSKQFVKDSDCSRYGFRRQREIYTQQKKAETPEELEAALRKSFHRGYTTIRNFAYHSGLKETSARNYLNKLCQGDEPLLRRYLEGRTMHYFLLKKTPNTEK